MPPAYFGTLPIEGCDTAQATRSHATLTPGAHPPPGKPEAHRNTTARSLRPPPFHDDHAGKPNSARRLNSTRRRSTIIPLDEPCGNQSKRQRYDEIAQSWQISAERWDDLSHREKLTPQI